MWTRLGPLFAAALAALTVLALTAGQALAAHVKCGDVITKDTTLDSDLIDCPSNGIVIGADNITLDLNGHTIDGAPRVDYSATTAGVINGGGDLPAHDGVVIKNGLIREFTHGVLNFASRNSMLELTTIGNGNGLALAGDHNLVAHNRAFDNWPANEGAGIRLEGGPGNRIRENLLSGNFWGIFDERGSGARIEHNRVSRNTTEGILIIEVQGAVIAKNFVADNNRDGIDVRDSGSVRIEGNRVFRSGYDGIDVGGDFEDGGNHLISDNLVESNQDDGIQILERNALSSGTLTRNRANENGDLGIEADESVIDGGGNRAFGNGNPLECVNVFCKTNGPG